MCNNRENEIELIKRRMKDKLQIDIFNERFLVPYYRNLNLYTKIDKRVFYECMISSVLTATIYANKEAPLYSFTKKYIDFDTRIKEYPSIGRLKKGEIVAFKLEGEELYSFAVFFKIKEEEKYVYILKKQSKSKDITCKEVIDYEDLLIPFPVNATMYGNVFLKTSKVVKLSESLKKVEVEGNKAITKKLDKFVSEDVIENLIIDTSMGESLSYFSTMYRDWRYNYTKKYNSEELRKMTLTGEYSEKLSFKEIKEKIKDLEKNFTLKELYEYLEEELKEFELLEEQPFYIKKSEIKEIMYEYEDEYIIRVDLDYPAFNTIEEMFEEELDAIEIESIILKYLESKKIVLKEDQIENQNDLLAISVKEEKEAKKIVNNLNKFLLNENEVMKIYKKIK